MNPEHYEMEFYEDESGSEPCREFIDGLPVPKKLALRAALVNILGRQGPDVCDTEFGKNLGQGLFEFRLRHSEAVILARVRPDLAQMIAEASDGGKILLRVFFHPYGEKIVLLLGGYDKGTDPSTRRQNREITAARKALRRWTLKHRVSTPSGPAGDRGVPLKRSFRTYWRTHRKSGR